MERYAFVDVSNTKGTVKGLLGFSIDWQKFLQFLKGEKWQCREVFYYEGRMETPKNIRKHDRLSKIGYSVRSKTIFLHRNKERMVTFTCDSCEERNSVPVMNAVFKCSNCSAEKIVLPTSNNHPKANFDVELAVDALDYARPNTEILIFSGDGDFRYLAEKLVDRGALVTFVSSTHKNLGSNKRFSTRLKDLITKEEARAREIKEHPRMRFLEIDNFRKIIGKDGFMYKENAAKRDVSE